MNGNSPVYGITYIDDQPWLVTLPDGGDSRKNASRSEYSKMRALVGGDVFHCSMNSWCSNSATVNKWDEEGAGYWEEAGYVTQRNGSNFEWDVYSENYRGYSTGFRPVLIPIDPETLQPDSKRLSTIGDGSIISMGTLYMDGKALNNPTNPIGCGQPQFGMSGPPLGNIPQYKKASPLAIGDTHPDPAKQIRFIKAGDQLISDRVILGCVSVSDLATNLKLKEYTREQSHMNEPIDLWARLGVCLTVTPEEFTVLKGEDNAAQELLVKLIQSNRCSMYGDSYFPEPANDCYLTEDLNFNLPDLPLHGDFLSKTNEAPQSTLATRLSHAQAKASIGHTSPKTTPNPPEH